MLRLSREYIYFVETLDGGQFSWGGCLPNGTGGVQWQVGFDTSKTSVQWQKLA